MAEAGPASESGKIESQVKTVPKAIFLENVAAYIEQAEGADNAIRVLTTLLSKYRYVERSLTARRANLKLKVPEIQQTLDAVNFLLSKKDADEKVETRFELGTGIFVNAAVQNPKTVGLWLGANVMVEYTLEEAQALLEENKRAAQETLKQLDEDLAYVRDQVNTTEVSITRVYNFDVKLRKARQGEGAPVAAKA
eukprot:EC724505.1.p1 GENE.EC724505.1~~EC724505.1.p1  ORF type:complete len:195 (+),score=40.89 EC724505.1:37-621(+)